MAVSSTDGCNTLIEPLIGIMGKTGAGKFSLCNALFQGK